MIHATYQSSWQGAQSDSLFPVLEGAAALDESPGRDGESRHLARIPPQPPGPSEHAQRERRHNKRRPGDAAGSRLNPNLTHN